MNELERKALGSYLTCTNCNTITIIDDLSLSAALHGAHLPNYNHPVSSIEDDLPSLKDAKANFNEKDIIQGLIVTVSQPFLSRSIDHLRALGLPPCSVCKRVDCYISGVEDLSEQLEEKKR